MADAADAASLATDRLTGRAQAADQVAPERAQLVEGLLQQRRLIVSHRSAATRSGRRISFQADNLGLNGLGTPWQRGNGMGSISSTKPAFER